MLNPRNKPKSPPMLEMKSISVILLNVSKTKNKKINANHFNYLLPIAVGFPKKMLRTAMSLSKAL